MRKTEAISEFKSILGDVRVRLGMAEGKFIRGEYGDLDVTLTAAIKRLFLAKKMMRQQTRKIIPSDAPVVAFRAMIEGWNDVFVAAKTPSKARWVVVRGLREAGWTDSGNFNRVSVRRERDLDKWAETAKQQWTYSQDAVSAYKAGV